MARRRNLPDIPAPTPPRPVSSPGSSSIAWSGFALVALTMLVYLPSIFGAFIWDDDAHLTQNPCIIGPLGFADIWTSAYARICPLTQSTWWLEHKLWGLHPLPYHLVTILLHALAAVVLWRVLRLLRVPGAWLGAALWALHPVQSESVAWITEMKNTQSGLFYVLAVLFFCKSRAADSDNTTSSAPGRNYFIALAFAALAMASKSSTVVLPVVLGLCAWWIDRRWKWRRNLLELAPVLLLSVATSLLTMWTQQGEGAFDEEFARTWAERIADAGRVVWFYAGKLAWPDPLIFIYPRWKIDASSVVAFLPVIALAVLLVVLWWKRSGWGRPAFFAVACFIAALIPVLGLVDTYFWRYSFVGDHFQYLASMGPLALAAAGIAGGARRFTTSSHNVAVGAGAVLIVALGALTWRQCGMFRNDETLWTTTIRLNPESWMAHNNLAVELTRQGGRKDEVIAHYEEALRLRPNHAKAQYNLALELQQMPGRLDESVSRYEEALRIDPTLGLAQLNLGALLADQPGRHADAVAHDEAAVRLLPNSAKARYNLAVELWKVPGRQQEALDLYRDAIRLQPDLAEAHLNLALALVQLPDGADEAESHFESALRIRPDWVEARLGYGILLSHKPDRINDSIAQFEQVLRLKPDSPLVHYNLAGVYYRAGRPEDAIHELEETLKLAPQFEDARRRLDSLRTDKRQ